MGVRLTRMSTSAVVLFALVALSLTPAADATCSGTKRNGNTFCAAATCTQAECCEYAPNTCAKYNGQVVGTNVYTCQAGAQYNSANAGSVLALGTTVAQFQAACCYTTAGTCFVHVCGANYATNTAVATTAGTTDAVCCTENPKSSAYTCPAGYTPTTANANNYGATTAACCTLTTGTCAAWFNGGNTCDANYHANAAALATTGATNAICCSENPKCSAYTCPAGYTATTANANNYIGAAITTTTVSTASTTACCTMTAGTCAAWFAGAGTCNANYHQNTAALATAGATNAIR